MFCGATPDGASCLGRVLIGHRQSTSSEPLTHSAARFGTAPENRCTLYATATENPRPPDHPAAEGSALGLVEPDIAVFAVSDPPRKRINDVFAVAYS